MIKSMTGYGRGELDTGKGRFTVEVKSVNSRSCTVIVKLPDILLSLDSRISAYIKTRLSRGQINVSVAFGENGYAVGKNVFVDRELAMEYCRQLADMKEYLSVDNAVTLDTIAALPGVINVEMANPDADELWLAVQGALEIAVNQLIEMRSTEGSAILEDLLARLKIMAEITDRIYSRAPAVVEDYGRRLRQRISDLLRDEIAIDESRIAMELAIVAERCDISEEIVRLRSHISQIEENLRNSDGPVGRHLDFILQEVNREVNTIASKASDVEISTDCIRFKDETDKMREQVQNIE